MNTREFLLRRNILKSLAEADGLLVLDEHLKQDVGMATPRMRPTEFNDALKAAEAAEQITSVSADRGVKYKINDQGKAWLSENG